MRCLGDGTNLVLQFYLKVRDMEPHQTWVEHRHSSQKNQKSYRIPAQGPHGNGSGNFKMARSCQPERS